MRINIRLTDDVAEEFSHYLAEHNLDKSDAGRIAIARLLQKKPKNKEREAAKLKRGNPNFGKE